MKTTLPIIFASALFALGGCTTTESNMDAGTEMDAGMDAGPGVDGGNDAGATDAGLLAPPTLGVEIDRMGRPAINTALTNPFDTLGTITGDQAKDEYNANSTPANWAKYVGSPTAGYFAGNLAIFDSLDTVCGNQVAAAGGAPSATTYAGLATVFADDQLFVNTGSSTCALYLGVELNATGIFANTDCGGRTPLEDVIDETYSALAVGQPSGVTDGVPQDNDGTASLTAFPFVTTPN
jgi:hypothetical protein